jgi:coproporphyrinogen III oxidase
VRSFDFIFTSADVSGGQDMTGYYPRETDRAGYHSLRENEAIGASYDRYLRNGVQ